MKTYVYLKVNEMAGSAGSRAGAPNLPSRYSTSSFFADCVQVELSRLDNSRRASHCFRRLAGLVSMTACSLSLSGRQHPKKQE